MGLVTLSDAACSVLNCGDPWQKARLTRRHAEAWHDGDIREPGLAAPPARPGRPALPELRAPRDMPRRGRGRSLAGRIALLHAVCHIELNAIDLAWDIIVRFSGADLPREFYDDWVAVAADEARHFSLLSDRLVSLGAAYGDHPAHDGLWEAAEATAGDLLARLAVVPLVLEARGLDVTPPMIANLEAAGDPDSARVLGLILEEETSHVAAGRRWFEYLCRARGLDPVPTYRKLVRTHFRGAIKPPFNAPARERAGFHARYYTALADQP